MTALAYNPFACGMGIDEDTAVFIDPDDMLEVVGSGAVTVVDPGDLTYSSIGEARHGETISLINARLHILTSGSKYNIATREPFIELEKELPKSKFCRVHKSYIVTLNKIESIERNRIKIKDNLIPISETYKDNFFKLIGFKTDGH